MSVVAWTFGIGAKRGERRDQGDDPR